MSRKNILGIIVALGFMLSFVLELTNAPLTQAFRSSFSILLLWVACAYWRYGEGIAETYNKQQAFITGGLFGGMVFVNEKRFFDIALDATDSLAPTMFVTILMILVIRIMYLCFRQGMGSFAVPPSPYWRFILFQTPIQMRKHTRE